MTRFVDIVGGFAIGFRPRLKLKIKLELIAVELGIASFDGTEINALCENISSFDTCVGELGQGVINAVQNLGVVNSSASVVKALLWVLF